MDMQVFEDIRAELSDRGKDSEKIDRFLERLQRHIKISEASRSANIPRNEPLTASSTVASGLEDIVKFSEKLYKSLDRVMREDELRARLLPEWQRCFSADDSYRDQIFEPYIKIIKDIHDVAKNTVTYQSSNNEEFKIGHLQKGYKNKRKVLPHWKYEYGVLLRSSLNDFFPEIKPTKSKSTSSPFYMILSLLINGDPSTTIQKLLEDRGD